MIKPFTFTIEPKEPSYRPGDLVGQPFVIPLSQVALSNNLADVLTDLTVINPDDGCPALAIYFLSAPIPDIQDGQAFVPDMRLYLGRVALGDEWCHLRGSAVDDQHRLRLPLYKSGDSKGAWSYIVTEGHGAIFKASLTVKIGVRQA